MEMCFFSKTDSIKMLQASLSATSVAATAGVSPHVVIAHHPQQPPVVVHPDLEHFFHMLWYSSKIEHVVRHMAKCWMEDFQSQSGAEDDRKDDGEEEEEEAAQPPSNTEKAAKKETGDEEEDDEEENSDEDNEEAAAAAAACSEEEEEEKEEAGKKDAGAEKEDEGAASLSASANKKEGLKMQAVCEKYSKVGHNYMLCLQAVAVLDAQ